MSALFAYHKTYLQGPFKQTYYFTKKKRPKIGDAIYIISGNSKRHPTYFLEGFYVIYSIGRTEGDRRELLLKPLLRGTSKPCISEESWFDNKEFRNFFTAGQSMTPVPQLYEARFHKMLERVANLDQSDLDGDAINDIGADHPEISIGYTARYVRDPKIRMAVMLRAEGRCEYCGKQGFICVGGAAYLEVAPYSRAGEGRRGPNEQCYCSLS